MDCPSCGHENREDARFCGECAAALAADVTCSSCGRSNPVGQKFCDGCAQPLGRAARAPARAPASYTPRHLAAKILRSKSALEGERKQVTVLFADVKGSMELAEQVDPEEWHRILDRFLQILAEGVHRFEGTVNQYTGDGIMALFGAPIAHEDHAQRACYAALHLQQELRRTADELRRTRGLNFAVRIGLNSGEVVVGKIGDDLRMDYTAQGYTVGLAQRVEQIAAPDRTNLTAHTAALVEGFFQLRDLGEFSLKGIREPARVYELEGAGALRTRLDRSRERGFSRFVGRDREVGVLELARDQALEGNGQVVGIVGEAGVGKSRLCYEFLERSRARGIAIYEAHCPAHGKTIPFLPLLELLREYFGLSERDSEAEARRKIAGTALLLDEGFRDLLPLLFEFLGAPDPEQPAPSMDPDARQRQLFAFVRRLVQKRSAREPTLLFVDDLHWIDPASDAFLAQIVEAVSGTRALLLLNFRPEYHADWMQKSFYQQLPLVPLGPEAIRELLEDLLGPDRSLAGLTELVHERTQGNPFFIEEVVQSLVESGSLEGRRGGYRLTRPVETLEIPRAVQVVLEARIDRLAELDKRVLQTAAVIGKLFPQPVLERVAELAEPGLAGALATLEAAEFVLQESLYPEVVYGFKHPLTHEAALHSQLADRRARLHASVADALMTLRVERLDENAALIAYHWEEAGDALEAARWHRRAAEWTGASDAVEADAHWRKVDTLLEAVDRSPEVDALRVAGISARLNLGWRVGMTEDEANALYARARVLASEGGNLRAAALLEAYYGFQQGFYNRFELTIEHGWRAVDLGRELGDPHLEAAMLGVVVRGLLWFSDFEQAWDCIERGRRLCGGDALAGSEVLGYSPLLFLELMRADSMVHLGSFGEAAACMDAAINRAREIGDQDILQFLNGDATWIDFLLGDARRALAHGRQAVEIAERVGGPVHRVLAQTWLCFALLADQDWNGLIETAERALAIVRESGVGLEWRGPVHVVRSAAEAALGDPDAARESARKGLELIRDAGNRIFEPLGLLLLARALLAPPTPDLAAAQEALDAAEASIAAHGARANLPLVHEMRAQLAELRGDAEARERELCEAQRLFAAVEAPLQVERIAALRTGASDR